MKLNSENYYSKEANLSFMSVSQFKDFYKCESLALAKLNEGFNEFEKSTALTVGNYVHSSFESAKAHEIFLKSNNDVIFKKNGSKYAEFETADLMIKRLKEDDFFKFIYQGEKEIILTPNLYGIDWKMRIDCVNFEKGYFIDLKTTREMGMRYWSNKYNDWVSFVENYDYVLQMAIYKLGLETVYKNEFTPYIMAVSKEKPNDIRAINFDFTRFPFEYETVKERINHFIDVKNGNKPPSRCEKCAYCRKTRKLTGFTEVAELLN